MEKHSRKRKSSTLESRQTISERLLKGKQKVLENTIQITNSSKMSDQVSISKEKVFFPFWSKLSLDWSQKLWLPIKTDYLDLPLTLSNGCSKNMIQKSWYTTKLKSRQTKQNYNKISSPLSQFLWQEITERDLHETEEREKEEKLKHAKKQKNLEPTLREEEEPLKARKYRIFPNEKQKETLDQWFGVNRWTYNKVVSLFINSVPKTKNPTKDELRNLLVYQEIYKGSVIDKEASYFVNPDGKDMTWMLKIPNDVRDAAVTDFLTGFYTAKRTRKKFKMHYRCKKKQQAFTIQARDVNRTEGVYYDFFHNLECEVPLCYGVGHAVKMIKELDGKYYMSISRELEIRDDMSSPEVKRELDGIVSCDPGVRTFQTTYSPSGIVTEWGKSDIKRIYRLCYGLDTLQSKWTRNKVSKKTGKRKWSLYDLNHRHRYNMKKAGARLRTKIKNLVKELHCKLVKWLLSEHRVVLLPKFETSQMLKKNDPKRGRRKINSKTARAMATWSHYKFKERLLFKSKEYPWCRVVICQEDYTSKTCGRCGWIYKKLGSRKQYDCKKCGLSIERDINGARNILIKYLTERGIHTIEGMMTA